MRRYRLGDLGARIAYASPEVGDALGAALGHLETGPDAHPRAESGSAPAVAPAIALDIVAEDGGYAVVCNGHCAAASLALDEIAPVVQRELLIEAYERSGCLVGIHAGAVASDDRCILLPGCPGSGKTTLTAALMHAGFAYLTDELALIMPRGRRHVLRPLPVGLGLKQGAWSVLASRFPAVATLPTHFQADGTAVRYLLPERALSAPVPEHRASVIVFPEYKAGEQTRLLPLSSAAALHRLSVAGFALSGDTTPELVQALIDWIQPLPCYVLRVGQLDAGVALLKGMLAAPMESPAAHKADTRREPRPLAAGAPVHGP
jgi:hypothetical protein